MRFEHGDQNWSEAVTDAPVIEWKDSGTIIGLDISFPVADGETVKVNSALVKVITSAVVGNRQLVFEAKDTSGMVVARISAGAVQAASTTRHYVLMQGTYRETTVINTELQVPIPADLFLPEGYEVRIYDSAAIDAVGDTMVVTYGTNVYKGL